MTMSQQELQEFHQRLHENNFQGQWEAHEDGSEPPRLQPYLWEWDEIRDMLEESKESLSLDDLSAGSRRAIILDNPVDADLRGPAWTMLTAVQMVVPGENARAHRHNFEAFRFVISGNDSVVTTVDGERLPARDGDLLLTPQMSWHDHINNSDEDVLWIDGLNTPFISDALHDMHFEEFQDDRQDQTHQLGYYESQFGTLRPADETASDATPPYRFPWEDAYRSLTLAAEDESNYDPYNGYLMEYVNPRIGWGPALQTISLRLQLLPAGEETRTHRHNNTEIYHVVEGEGKTTIGDQTFEWQEGDFLVVPPSRWHSHENTSTDDVILFNISDKPIFDAFNLTRIETGDD